MMKVKNYLVLLATAVLCRTDQNLVAPVIDTNAGQVSGVTLKSFSGNDFLVYLGNPFAEPPVNHLRFQVCTNEILKILYTQGGKGS